MFNIFPKAVVNGTLNEFNYNESKLVRMTISMDKCKVINENVLFDKNCELPTVSDRSVGKNNEFILLNYNNKHMFLKDLAKIDLNQNRVVTREFGKNEYAGEPLHIKDDKTDYIIALVYNAESDKSEVRILDFESLEDVAKFDLPYDVHYSYHGKWKELS
jgi:carotenoid cleavage dioxygenase